MNFLHLDGIFKKVNQNGILNPRLIVIAQYLKVIVASPDRPINIGRIKREIALHLHIQMILQFRSTALSITREMWRLSFKINLKILKKIIRNIRGLAITVNHLIPLHLRNLLSLKLKCHKINCKLQKNLNK